MTCMNFSQRARHRASIYQKNLAADNYGGFDNTWALLATVWAIVEPKSGSERFLQGANESTVTTKIIIRYQSDLKDTADGGQVKITIDGVDYSVLYSKNLADDGKNYGHAYQEFGAVMSGAESDG